MIMEFRIVATLGDILNGKGHERDFQGGGNILYLDIDCRYTDMNVYKNIRNNTCQMKYKSTTWNQLPRPSGPFHPAQI